jgi:transcriptional regulator with XRE-family HTH domain
MPVAQTPEAVLSLVELRAAIASGRVREIRQKARLSQAELAKALGVTPAAVSRWESRQRQPKGEAAERLAHLLPLLASAVNEPPKSASPGRPKDAA